MAVQWRTETSTGNLTMCYQHVREGVEKYLAKKGFAPGQVFFNTDLTPHTSGTYASQVWLLSVDGFYRVDTVVMVSR